MSEVEFWRPSLISTSKQYSRYFSSSKYSEKVGIGVSGFVLRCAYVRSLRRYSTEPSQVVHSHPTWYVTKAGSPLVVRYEPADGIIECLG